MMKLAVNLIVYATWLFFIIAIGLVILLAACTDTHGVKAQRALREAGDSLQAQGRSMMLESRLQMMNAAPHH